MLYRRNMTISLHLLASLVPAIFISYCMSVYNSIFYHNKLRLGTPEDNPGYYVGSKRNDTRFESAFEGHTKDARDMSPYRKCFVCRRARWSCDRGFSSFNSVYLRKQMRGRKREKENPFSLAAIPNTLRFGRVSLRVCIEHTCLHSRSAAPNSHGLTYLYFDHSNLQKFWFPRELEASHNRWVLSNEHFFVTKHFSVFETNRMEY